MGPALQEMAIAGGQRTRWKSDWDDARNVGTLGV